MIKKIVYIIFIFEFHFEWLVFAFLAFCGPTEYVYKVWLSLVRNSRILIFHNPSPHFEWLLKKKKWNDNVKNYLLYNFASNGIWGRVNSLGVSCLIVSKGTDIFMYIQTQAHMPFSTSRYLWFLNYRLILKFFLGNST